MPVTLRSNAVNAAPGRTYKRVRIHRSPQEPTVIKSIAMTACIAVMMLVAGAGANASSRGGDELFAGAPTLESETSAPAPKDHATTEQNGK